jgi:endogenous inhibitor of DNA gyrase (YacG/DUF329 family)
VLVPACFPVYHEATVGRLRMATAWACSLRIRWSFLLESLMSRASTCPICDQPVSDVEGPAGRFFPFCSQRCRQVDLLRWSRGEYRIVEPLTPDRLAEELLEGDPSALDDLLEPDA